jgi:hypothetical protein
MKSCLYVDFGFGAKYFQIVVAEGLMAELYPIMAPKEGGFYDVTFASDNRDLAFSLGGFRSGSESLARIPIVTELQP